MDFRAIWGFGAVAGRVESLDFWYILGSFKHQTWLAKTKLGKYRRIFQRRWRFARQFLVRNKRTAAVGLGVRGVRPVVCCMGVGVEYERISIQNYKPIDTEFAAVFVRIERPLLCVVDCGGEKCRQTSIKFSLNREGMSGGRITNLKI